MTRITGLFATCGLALVASGASPAPAQERIGTLQQGRYECGLPGDAAGKAWQVDAEYAFSITSASRYRSAKGSGTYLLRGKEVLFTRGPMKDMRMHLHASGLLQQVNADGSMGRLRCHRIGR